MLCVLSRDPWCRQQFVVRIAGRELFKPIIHFFGIWRASRLLAESTVQQPPQVGGINYLSEQMRILREDVRVGQTVSKVSRSHPLNTRRSIPKISTNCKEPARVRHCVHQR